MDHWIKTDEMQWVRRINENEFVVLDTTLFHDATLGDWYVLQEVDVDFSILSDSDLSKEISGYYRHLKDIKEEYGDDWKQIVAEIIAENTDIDTEVDKTFDSIDKIIEYLELEFGIEV